MSMYPHLFEPITIRGLTLKNRIVMPGMGTLFMKDGHVNDRLIDYHVARTRGGTGLNVVEVSCVHAPSAPAGFGSLATDDHIPGYRRLTDAIHAAGGKASVFLWQGGLVAAGFPGVMPVLPSPMDLGGGLIPEASLDLLDEVRVCYGRAAARAVEAGMDAVELHAAHTYLIHSFLSGALNRRTDKYGGDFAARMRYPLEVVAEIRRNIPDDMPFFMRVNAHDDYLDGGLTLAETCTFVKAAGELGVDVVDVSRGNTLGAGLKYEVPSCDIPYGFNVDNAAHIRAETGVLTMAVGRINGAQLAENILRTGKANLIGMGRVQLTDPEFCNKARDGRVAEIERCIGCNQGCFDAHMRDDMEAITCLRNPAVGRERELAIAPAERPKTVLVVGGGMGGMAAAATLRARGHGVTLLEGDGALGGQFIAAGEAPRKGEFKAAAKHKATRVAAAGVAVKTSAEASAETLRDMRPDAVVLATGAKPVTPPIPGTGLDHVCGAVPMLLGQRPVTGDVVVIGGGLVGLEVTEYLMERGHGVTVVEMQGEVGAGLGAIRKICVMENIAKYPVTLLTGAACRAITESGVTVSVDGGERFLPCDTVVIAAGSRPVDASELTAACEGLGIPLYAIGDALGARCALDAVREGYETALKV